MFYHQLLFLFMMFYIFCKVVLINIKLFSQVWEQRVFACGVLHQLLLPCLHSDNASLLSA